MVCVSTAICLLVKNPLTGFLGHLYLLLLFNVPRLRRGNLSRANASIELFSGPSLI
jgi:hypothetical protein